MGNTSKTSKKGLDREPIPSGLHQRQLDYIAFLQNNPAVKAPEPNIRQSDAIPQNKWTKFVGSFNVHRNNLKKFTSYSSRGVLSNSEVLTMKQISTEITLYSQQSPALRDLTFNLTTYQDLDQDVRAFIRKIGENMVYLHNFRLIFRSCYDLTNPIFETIGSQICRRLVNLRTIHFEFENMRRENNIGNLGLWKLIHYISRYLNKLQRLSLSFNYCYVLNDPQSENLFQVKARSSSLQRLALIFKYCGSASLLGMQVLRFIEDQKNLQQLKLSFYECHGITDELFQYVISIIKHLTELESLSLTFYKSREITDSGFKSIQTEILPQLGCLKTLQIGVTSSSVTEAGIRDLVDAINKQKPQLKKLMLYFRHIKNVQVCDDIRAKLTFIPVIEF